MVSMAQASKPFSPHSVPPSLSLHYASPYSKKKTKQTNNHSYLFILPHIYYSSISQSKYIISSLFPTHW